MKRRNADAHAETLASIPAEEITAEMQNFSHVRLHFIELYEEDYSDNFAQCACKLSDFDLDNYLIADGELLEIHRRGWYKHTPLHTLREVIDFLRSNGRKGIEIQRYKGLGEMNADQLWETTMDPAKRTLIKVTMPDIVAADHMLRC